MDTPPIIFNGRRFYKTARYWISTHPEPTLSLHRAVWEATNGPIPKGYHIHHRDGDKDNNALENLEMLSCTEHLSNHFVGKFMPKGEASPLAHLTDAQALEVRQLYSAGGVTYKALARRFEVSEATIAHVVRGDSYPHLPMFPPPPLPTHCRRGHEFTPENTMTHPPFRRKCRACYLIARRAVDARRRDRRNAERRKKP